MRRAAFLDRDGVVNRKAAAGRYVIRWEEMRILPGVARGISLLNQAGFRVVVVSNQRCVARGLITVSALEGMHRRMCEALAGDGATIDAIYYCPHEAHPPCVCRKPAPGMLLAAAREHKLDLAASWMIGDSNSDVTAGIRAGCRTALLAKEGQSGDGRPDLVAKSLLDAVERILHFEGAFAERLGGAAHLLHGHTVSGTE
jgi:D-glycero-D-manno-heptose 1,7-bisphosphate phosphatase